MSSTLNVFRYGALVAGVFYGFSHDLSLKSEAAKKKEEAEYQKKLNLIAQAKAEYKKLNPPKVESSTTFDLENPDLDFAKAIESAIAGLEN
ncbi:F1F0 ATP synthase subunit E [Pichia kluyveri]|uniref:ATP synthase F(0) complex subunit e, mitochondrial n=1 Tax=Pichia kluyveri TaxID=36015 RepID=A0AAV5QZT7_PICKL|nr:F1F0 ATP synthase subunit E [Pichia kluyveri]